MPNFKPMLATAPKLDKDGKPVLKFPLRAQPKFDGIRASVVNGKLVSRNLKLIPNREVQAALGRPEYEGIDGELIVGSPTAEDAFRVTTSYCMASDKTGGNWTFYVFDKWNHPGTYSARMVDAIDVIDACDRMSLVPTVEVADEAELERVEGALLEQGYEGVILRGIATPYKFGRASKTKGELVKLKRFTDFEAEVIGVMEEMHNANEAKTNALGRTERSSHKAGKIGKGTLGKLRLRALNGPWKGVEFSCGTGFDKLERKGLWIAAHTDESGGDLSDGTGLNDRIAKVKAFEIGAKDAPRFPVFLGWRAEGDMS